MKLLTGITNRNSSDQSTVDWTAAGDLARDQKDWHGAVACYRKVVDLDPTLEHIWVQLGNCAKESGRPEEAGAAYGRALTIDPMNADTHLQLGHLLKVQGNLAEAKASYLRALEINRDLDSAKIEVLALEELSVPTAQSSQERDLQRRVLFECSDLVEYFLDNRLPTGIQRVQINIVKEALASEEFGKTVRVIFYSQNDRSWHEITHLDFLSLINAGQKLDAVSDEAWVAVRGQACVARRENTFHFAGNDTLINIGTSWWIVDYFLRIRNLQDQVDLKYIPFVHDCIPLVAPEHCAGNLTKDFAAWIDGVFLHADYFLANSKSTAADLARFAVERGHKPPSVHVVQLDGDLAAGSQEAGEAPGEGELNESVRQVVAKLFQSNNIPFRRNETPRFALFVSTLESRKNHILAFTVWDHLIARRGLENTPYLICVGKRGWMFDAATAYLGGRPKLQHRVRFLSGVDDRSLSALYSLCEFTLYPSYYEGWGLPVTESLCHGKVPVVASVSSLPEAGGAFAVYFDPFNRGEAYAHVERLVTDQAYRHGLEAKIREGFRPRTWAAIAEDLLRATSEALVARQENSPGRGNVERVEPVIFYEFSSRTEWNDSSSRPASIMRYGDGWFSCEEWGAWTGEADTRIKFEFVDQACAELLVFMKLKGAPSLGSHLEVSANFSKRTFELELRPNEVKWFRLGFPVAAPDPSVKELTVANFTAVDLKSLTGGSDRRSIGSGVCSMAMVSKADFEGRLTLLEALAQLS